MRVLLSLTAVFMATACYSQDYVVTLKSDTIRASVKILSYDLMDRVQAGSGKGKTVFAATQVRRVFYGGEFYAPIKYDNMIRMMKIIRTGFLSLYSYRPPNQMSYDGRLLVKMGAEPQEVPNLGFKKYVGGLVEDCPDVADRVKVGTLDRKNIEQLVDDYNKCVQATQERRLDVAAEKVVTPTTEVVEQLRTKVNNSDLAAKQDVNDLLGSISEKIKKNEPVPAYMKEGLKGYLAGRDDFKEDLEKLLGLLNN